MGLDTATAIQIAIQDLRRRYGPRPGKTADTTGLHALADKLGDSAFEEVTITGNAYEGGSATGEVAFPRLAYLGAVNALITELDPAAPQAPSCVRHADFSHSHHQV
ncbi:MAG: hypothetical protein LBK99_27455 [Opitutaceae bacterium]|jgi:hypothetical protein|nr:hypothetical protein [Opitutaceae bacterium]